MTRTAPLAALVFFVGCGIKVTRTNPYDPQAPVTLQAQGRLDGSVVVEAAATFDAVEITVTQANVTDVPLSYTTSSLADGSWAIEVPPGTYNVKLVRPGYAAAFVNGVSVGPGEQRNVGSVSLIVARGIVTGSVSLIDGAVANGTTVSLIPLDIPGGRILTALAASDGSYFIEGLPSGTYRVRAEKEGYAPAYTASAGPARSSEPLTVVGGSIATAPPLVLYPASAIVKVERDGAVMHYSNDRNVQVVLYPFVEFLTQMRVSQSHAFDDPRWDIDYRDFSTPIPFELADIDGTQIIYAQFKDSFGLESPIFMTSIVLDRELPQVLSFTLNSGAPFLTAADGAGQAALGFVAKDLLSGIDAWRWTLEPAFTSEGFTPIDSTGPVLNGVETKPLGDSSGLKTVLLQLRDRAGNLSTPASASIMRDRSPPTLGVPALAINPLELDSNGAVSSLNVTLSFNVTGNPAGEAMTMAVANSAGLDGNSLFVPFATPYIHTLAPGTDAMPRQVCAMFRDAAGLLTTQQCIPVKVDRTGSISGIVTLEGRSNHTGILVEIPGTTHSTYTDASGHYQIDDIPGGSSYLLHFYMADFVELFVPDVVVTTGAVSDRGRATLAIPRATVTGTVTLVGKNSGEYGGIVISDQAGQYTTVTAPNGAFVLPGLPAISNASYTLSADYPGYFQRTFPMITGLAAGETRPLSPALSLQRQRGDYRICSDAATPVCPIEFTKSRTVTLEVSSTQFTFWRVSDGDPTFSGDTQPCVTFDNSQKHFHTFPAAQADGPADVYVQFCDDASTPVGTVLQGTVKLDTTPPQPSAQNALIIDPQSDGVGATYNNRPDGAVTLAINATDATSGIQSVIVARDTPTFNPASAQPYAAFISGAFLDTTPATSGNPGGERSQTLFVQLCDYVGNCTCGGPSGSCTAPALPDSPSDTIVHDTLPPSSLTGASILVQGTDAADTVTNNPFVVVTVNTGDAVAVRLGNDPNLVGASFLAVPPSGSVDLPHLLELSGASTKQVYAQFRDAAGNESPIGAGNPNVDAIDLDTTPPSGLGLAISEGNATNQPVIHLAMTALGASQYLLHFGATEDFSGETWQAFAPSGASQTMTVTAPFPVPLTDGVYTAFVQFRDAAGNTTATTTKTVTRDTVPPQYPALSFLEGASTTIQTVNLVLSAIGAEMMIIAPDGVIAGQTPEIYSPTKSIQLMPGTPGLHTVAVRFVDAAGNYADATNTIMWDATPPTLTSFSISEAPYTTSTNVTLQIAATGATRMRVSNNSGFVGVSWEPYATSRSWLLLPGDGQKHVYLSLQDDAGNTSNPVGDAVTTLDTQPPGSLVVSIAGGSGYTQSATVSVSLSAVDNLPAPVAQVMLANDALFTGASWQSYQTTINDWVLSSGDGAKTVYVRFRDNAQNVSESADTITLDTQSPTAVLSLANGAAAITSPTLVPVSIVGSSDIQWMKFVEGSSVNCASVSIDVPFNGNTSYTFAGTPADGPLPLTVCLKDFSGRIGSASTTVLLDRVVPAASLLVNGTTGGFTNAGVVTLTISASDSPGSGVSAIRVANQQDMTGVAWEPYTSPRTWTLAAPSSEGVKTVWLEVRDIAGNVHDNVSCPITLDFTPPSGSISVTQGAYSQSNVVDLTTTRGGDTNVTEMAVKEGFLDCGGATYGAYAASVPSLSLSTGDGLKTLSLCLRDRAGNTAGFSTAVTVDTDNPVGTLAINNDASYTQVVGVTLNLTADADVVDMRAAAGASIDCSTGTYTGSFNPASGLTLPTGDGLKTVWVCLKDAAGRTAAISDTIILDTTNPTPAAVGGSGKLGVIINNDDAYTNLAQVGLTLAASDLPVTSGVVDMKISDGGACVGGNWQPYVTSASWNLQPGDNQSRSVSVQFRDAAGRVSSCATDDITIDTVNSTVTVFTLDGGGATPEYTNDALVSVTALSYSGTCSSIEIGEDPNFGGAQTRSYPCGQTWPTGYTLFNYAPSGTQDGSKTIYARIRDAANNPNPSVSRAIILDTQGNFNGTFTINGGVAYTNSQSLTLALVAANATDMYIASNGTCSGGAWEAFKTSTLLAHPSSSSPLTVSVRFRDAAANLSPCIVKTINYDPSWSGGGAISVIPIVGTSPYTTSLDVNLQLTAGEPATSSTMKISNVAGCGGGVWQPYPGATSPQTVAWTLASGGDNVTRTVSVQYSDAAGNLSACYTYDVQVDTVAPAGLSLTLDSGASYNTSGTRTANVSVSGIGFSDVRLSESPSFAGATWATGVANPYAATFVLSPTSGDKTVYVQARDAAGNISTSSASDTITLDNVAPVGAALALDGGATYTTSNSGTVAIALSATDDFSGVTNVRYRTSPDGTGTWSGYTTVGYQPTINVVLYAPVTAQNGVNRYVELSYIDKAGNISTPSQDAIILDNVAPVAGGTPILINGGATSTTSQTVNLAFAASGATQMMVSNGQVCQGGGWVTYAGSLSGWSLDGVGDNVQKYVSVRFADAAGNTSSCYSASINVDNVAPVAQSFAIENGASFSNSNTLNLNVIYSGTATQRFVATSVAGLSGATGQDPATPATFDATGLSDGTVTLYVQFRDAAGNLSNTLSDTIFRDRTAPTPGLLAIDNGAVYSTSAAGTVNLSLSANDGLGSGVSTVSYRTSSNGTTWSGYTTVAYQPTVTITLASPSNVDKQTRYVEVYYTDAAGNASGSASDTIFLDNVAPTLATITVVNSAGASTITNDQRVRVLLGTVTGNPTSMLVSNTNNCAGGQTLSYQTSLPWLLDTTGEGVSAEVSVRLVDDAGLSSGCITDAIPVDTVAPVLNWIGLAANYDGAGTQIGDYWNLTRDCYLALTYGSVTGNYVSVDLSMSASFSTVFQSVSKATIDATTVNPYPYYYGILVPGPTGGLQGCTTDGNNEGSRTVYYRAVDSAGNVSGVGNFAFTIDTTPPSIQATSIDGGAFYTSSTTLNVAVNATDANYITQIFMNNDFNGVCSGATSGTRASSWYYGAGYSYPYTLPAGSTGSGVKTIYTCLKDGAGNTTLNNGVNTLPAHYDSIILDTTPPTGLSISAGGVTGGTVSGSVCTPAPHWVTSSTVALSIAATDALSGVASYRITENGEYGPSLSWFGGTTTYSMTAVDGAKLLGLEVTDRAGSVATAATPLCLTLDQAPPSGGLTVAASTSVSPVPVTLTAADNLSTASDLQFCFGNASTINPNGILKADGVTVIGSKASTATSCNNWYTYNGNSSITLSLSSTTNTLYLYLRDGAGNQAGPFTASVTYDSSPPSVPSLNVVQVGNHSAHLYWSASTDAQSGIARYDIQYREVWPTTSAYQTLSVDASLRDYELTSREIADLGLTVSLDNRKRYEFQIRAVNSIGGVSAYSTALQNTVGWKRTTAVFSGTDTLVPFGIAEYDGIIYVGYLKYDIQWGNTASTAHMAISSDGGVSWATTTIDPNVCSGRETLGMYVGPAGIVVAGAYDSLPDDFFNGLTTVSWRSTDQGNTWTTTTLDGSNAPATTAGVGLAAQGGALVLLFQRSSDYDIYEVRSYDGGETWTTPIQTVAVGSLVNSIAACNTQFNIPWAYRLGNDLHMMRSNDLGATSSQTTLINGSVTHEALGCTNATSVANYGKAYSVHTNTGSSLMVRSLTDAAVGSWSGSDTTLRTGVDVLNRPAFYSAGTTTTETAFVAYRDTSGSVWFGESSAPGSASYTWTKADMSGGAGVNLVMNATAQSSPILAYTDESGQSLYVLRSSLPAPVVHAHAGENRVDLLWRGVPGAETYSITGISPAIQTPDTNWVSTAVTGANTYEVSGFDAFTQSGEPGMRWQIGSFTPSTVDSANSAVPTSLSSASAALVMPSATELDVLLPVGFPATFGVTGQCDSLNDICLYRSTDSGASFSGSLISDMSTTPQVAKSMSWGLNTAGTGRLHVAHTNSFVSDPDLVYRYANSPYTSWSGLTLDSSDTSVVGDATGEQVQVDLSGTNDLLVVWVLPTNESGCPSSGNCRNIRYQYSLDAGRTDSTPTFANASPWVRTLPLNSSALNTDIGYTPTSLTIIDHSGTYALLGWIDGSAKVRIARTSSYATSPSPPPPSPTAYTPATWTINQVSSANENVSFIRGARYLDSHIIAFIGRPNTIGAVDSVWAYVSGYNAPNSSNTGWTTVHIDSETAIANSLSVDVSAAGFYVTYATTRSLFGVATRQLKLAYCKHECTSSDNWNINVLKTDTDAYTADFGAALLVRDLLNNLYVGAGLATGASSGSYLLERSGRFNRQR